MKVQIFTVHENETYADNSNKRHILLMHESFSLALEIWDFLYVTLLIAHLPRALLGELETKAQPVEFLIQRYLATVSFPALKVASIFFLSQRSYFKILKKMSS